MKTNDLENKNEKLFRALNKGVNESVKLMDAGFAAADKLKVDLFASMTVQEIEKHKAFELKYSNLIVESKIEEAQQLKDKYINE